MYTVSAQSTAELAAIVVRPPVLPVTRVVVGVDGSAGSAAALRWAVAEACRRQILLHIVSAWEEAERPGLPIVRDPARIAAERVQKALARVLFQQHYPSRIGCTTPKGVPGEVLLSQVTEAGLLVLGVAGTAAMKAPGRTGRYCLSRGRGPLVFVPALRT